MSAAKQRNYRTDLGIPNWRNASEYPDESASMDAWRWEYLRRRPDYREAWREQYDRSQAFFDECFAQGNVFGPHESRANYYRIGSQHVSDMATVFGLNFILAPCEPCQPHMFWRSFGFMVPPDVKLRRLDHEKHSLVAFDLSKPIDEQLRRAKGLLKAHQKSRYPRVGERHHINKWQRYLRVLDAREAGATYEQIFGETVGADDYDGSLEKNWAASGQQLWKQAQELMFKVTS